MAARRTSGKGTGGTRKKASAQRPKRASDSSGSRRKKSPAASKAGGAAGKRRKKAAAKRRWRWITRRRVHLTLRIFAAAAFVLGFVGAQWVLGLDKTVRARFEGRRFSVPSRVYSAPTILYAGLDASRVGLRETLQRLGYREQAGYHSDALAEGRYRTSPGRIRVHLRPFSHPTRSEPARDIELRIRGRYIEEIREYPRGSEAGAVMLEPEQVGAFYGADREQRDLIRLDEVPPFLISAVLAVEDRRFEQHHGVDPRRIAGAFLANLRAGGIRQGASTLTQQLTKNFFLTPERTFKRKFTEAVMALVVEARYGKPAILEAYLNEIYLGQRGPTAVHGVGEAARFLFGKRVSDLTLGEAALIAAIIQSPNRLSPHRNAKEAVRRRNLVLSLMREQGRIGGRELAAAQAAPLGVAEIAIDPGDARYFLDLLRRQLPEVYDTEILESEGLRIYSTLDPRLQRAAARALSEGLEALEAEFPQLVTEDPAARLQGCLLALRPQTGEILALVGGRDYGLSQFDRCTQARRQVGSIFKPIVYAAALEPVDGIPDITLASFLDDDPFELDTPQGPWAPENFDHEFHGRVSVREALERSMNVASARLGQRVGIGRVAAMAERLGVSSRLPHVPSLALGTAELSPLEVARVYATFATGGVRPWPHAFEDVVAPEAGTLERRELRFERVLDAGTAFLTVELLRGVVDRGTGVRVRSMGMRGDIAGKTGTTDDEHDLWFVGFTPQLVAVVWLGFDKPRSIGITSSRGAIPIWVEFAREALGSQVRGRFLKPAGVNAFAVDPLTGALAASSCPRSRNEYFLEGTEPSDVCTFSGLRRRDARGRRSPGILDWLFGP